MYKEILVPLDGSKRAETILAHVEELAQRFESEVSLLDQRGRLNRKLRFGDCHLLAKFTCPNVITESRGGAVP